MEKGSDDRADVSTPGRARRGVLIAAVLGLTACLSDRPDDPEESAGAKKILEKSAQTDTAPVLSRTRGISEDATMLWFSGRWEAECRALHLLDRRQDRGRRRTGAAVAVAVRRGG